MTDSGAAVFSYDGSGIIEKSVRGSSPLGDVIYAIQESYLPDIVSKMSTSFGEINEGSPML